MQQNQEIVRGQIPEDDTEFLRLLKRAMPAESPASPSQSPLLPHLPSSLSCSQVGRERIRLQLLGKASGGVCTKGPWESREKMSRSLCKKYLPKEIHEKAGPTSQNWKASALLGNSSHWLGSANQMSLALSSVLGVHFLLLSQQCGSNPHLVLRKVLWLFWCLREWERGGRASGVRLVFLLVPSFPCFFSTPLSFPSPSIQITLSKATVCG